MTRPYPHHLMTPESRLKNKLALRGRTCWKKGKKDPHHSVVMKELYKSGKRKPVMMVKESNPAWKGNNVGYYGIHKWIVNEKGKAKYLYCSQYDDGSCHGRLEWSNISGKYRRNITDWWVLCTSHHKRYDSKYSKTCSKCNNPHRSKGLCKEHYVRYYYLKNK